MASFIFYLPVDCSGFTVSDEDWTHLVEATVVPGSVTHGQETTETGVSVEVVNLGEVKHLRGTEDMGPGPEA